MKGIWLAGLVTVLAGHGTFAPAEEYQWRPVAAPSAAVSLGRPVPLPPQPLVLPPELGGGIAGDPRPAAESPVASSSSQTAPVPPFPPLARAQAADLAQALPRGSADPAAASVIAATDAAATEKPSAPTTPPAVSADPSTWGATLDRPIPAQTPAIGRHPPGSDDEFAGDLADVETEPGRLDVRLEALYWWVRHGQAPPLVTTGPASSQGILGQPGTVVLFGGSNLDTEEQWGGRFRLGYWLDEQQTCGLEAGFFFLAQRSVPFEANSSVFPVLARPFFNLNAGTEFVQVTTGPGVTGSITASSPTRLWGADANLRYNLLTGCAYRLDLLAGFRYLNLQEGLDIVEDVQVAPNAPSLAGDHITVFDSFATRNSFYGEQVGLSGEYRRGRWSFELRGQVALGINHEVVDIHGGQAITTPEGTTSTFNGGLLALATNSGRTSQDHFAVVPEVGLTVGYQVTDHLRAFAGYNFLYWSNVVRPGDQIDRAIDVTHIPNFPVAATPTGLARPAVLFRESDFWAQGATFGLEFRF